ncbi:MAG: helix-turn-helix domain-containing protein [Steroidobacteraceae bacterium]
MSPTKQNAAARAANVNLVKSLLRSGEGARALQTIGDRWSFLLLRDAFLGARRFEDFRRLTGAARGTLSSRLGAFVDEGILYRAPYGSVPGRHEYRLTDKGLALYPLALSLWNWETRWSSEFGLPPRLVHEACGRKMHPQLTCAHCGQVVDARDVSFEAGPGARAYGTKVKENRRRRSLSGTPAAGVDTTMFHSIDTIGDRWSGLLLASLFLGLRRHDDINAALGIATNILSDRLRRLLSAGVIEQHLYRDRPARYEYRLTEKGRDFYPFVMTLHEWATTWLRSPLGPALRFRHRSCGHTLRSRMACSECHAQIDPHEVGVKAGVDWRRTRRLPPTRSR